MAQFAWQMRGKVPELFVIGGTLFSGIGAPEQAAPWIDWKWCAEIEPFAAAVHKARFPGVPNLGDVTKIDPAAVEPVDLLVFGSPCQSFSVAGKRAGLDDPRGNLALVALRLVSQIRPRWFLFENVPGLLSSDNGRDFGAFLAGVEQCGYGWAYRTLNAEFAGVPQRRRRVFVVGHLGDWRSAAAVLFEPASLRGHPAPGRAAGEGIANSLVERPDRGGGNSEGQRLMVGKRTNGDGYRDGDGLGNDGDPMFTLQSGAQHAIAFDPTARQPKWGIDKPLKCDGPLAVAYGIGSDALDRSGEGAAGNAAERAGLNIIVENLQPSLRARSNNGVAAGMSVRRLTPKECERLQGFPDDWTAIQYRGKAAADGPRYRALGNSMAVPVVRWIIERIGRQ